MMPNKNTNAKVRLPNVNTDVFVIVNGVLEVYTLALYLLIIC